MCYKDRDILIPLFDKDETFTIKLDLNVPVFKEDKLEAALSTPFEFELSDVLSGLFSVSAQQGEDKVESLGDVVEKKSSNSNILLSCQKNTTETDWKCTITVHTRESVTITATDKVDNSETQNLTVGEWTCVPKFHVKDGLLTVPDSVEELTSGVLDGCVYVTEVVIGKGVGSIDTAVFDNLTHVKSFSVNNNNNTVFSTDSGALYETVDEDKTLIRYSQAREEKTIEILEGTSIIGARAFNDNKNLTSITLPTLLTTIEENAFSEISITSLALPDGTLDIVLPSETGYLNGKVLTIFEKNFNNNTLDITPNLDLSSSNLDDETKKRFTLWDEESNKTMTTVTVSKEKKKYVVKAAYKDGDKELVVNNSCAEVRVLMNYLESSELKVGIPRSLIFDIDNSFTVQVKEESAGDDKWETITTLGILAALKEEGSSVMFKRVGTFIFRVSPKSGVNVDQTVTITLSSCDEADNVFTDKDVEILTHNFNSHEPVEILVISNTVKEIENDAILSTAHCLKGIVVEESENVKGGIGDKARGCNFGMDGDTYRHIPVFRVNSLNTSTAPLPDWNGDFKSGEIPILWFPAENETELLVVKDGITTLDPLSSTNNDYQIYTLSLAVGDYSVENRNVNFKVVDWKEDEQNYGATEELVVPYGVYQIGRAQYSYNRTIQSVTFPPTVKIINAQSFYDCGNLTTVTFSEGLKSIGDNAFRATKLKSVELPASVEIIGLAAFASYNPLATVTLNDGLVEITGNPFYSSQLETIKTSSTKFIMNDNDMELIDKDTETLVAFLCGRLNEDGTYQISSNVKIIRSDAFSSCLKLKSVTLHDNLKTVGRNAFDSTSLVSIDIPASVESIGNFAFGSCQSLLTLTIEEGMEGTIGDYTLFDSSLLEELTLPESLWTNYKLISDKTFNGSNLTKIIFSCDKGSSSCASRTDTYKGKEVTIECGVCSSE